jgi:hypothetical protein
MFVKIVDNNVARFPYNIGDLKKENPSTSFPKPITENELAAFDVYPVTSTASPAFDNKTHRVRQGVELIDGVWTQTWSLQELPEQQANDNIRAERDRRLAKCDWSQLSDAPVDSTAWATYRQALRDLPSQSGFPFNITWPTQP